MKDRCSRRVKESLGQPAVYKLSMPLFIQYKKYAYLFTCHARYYVIALLAMQVMQFIDTIFSILPVCPFWTTLTETQQNSQDQQLTLKNTKLLLLEKN